MKFALLACVVSLTACHHATVSWMHADTRTRDTTISDKPDSSGIEARITVRDGQLYVDDSPVTIACISLFMTELNGDNLFASIYLERNSYRGCLDSNHAISVESSDELNYEVVEKLPENIYKVLVIDRRADSSTEGVERVIVQFRNRIYQLEGGGKVTTLSMDKLGEW